MAKLFVVPTPIGNLEDFTFRAVRILEESNLILAEDTRTSAKLMAHYNISTPMRSHHMHNEHKTVEKWVGEILNGNTIALITDAGTPAISDPGFLLVRECIKNDIEIDCLPGATAFVPALVNSRLPCDKFTFEGFLPQKKGRQTRLKALAEETKTMVFYESPYRVKKTLEQFIEYMGEDRQVSVSREISKKFEETVRGSVSDVLAHFDAKEPKGEFVIVLEGLK
jgi:16S rRNA (cytidine1402-2'-O)-methyltransferase